MLLEQQHPRGRGRPPDIRPRRVSWGPIAGQRGFAIAGRDRAHLHSHAASIDSRIGVVVFLGDVLEQLRLLVRRPHDKRDASTVAIADQTDRDEGKGGGDRERAKIRSRAGSVSRT